MPPDEDEYEASISSKGKAQSSAPITRKSSKRSVTSEAEAMDVDDDVEESSELVRPVHMVAGRSELVRPLHIHAIAQENSYIFIKRDEDRCNQCVGADLQVCYIVQQGGTSSKGNTKRPVGFACVRCHEKKTKCSLGIGKGAASTSLRSSFFAHMLIYSSEKGIR